MSDKNMIALAEIRNGYALNKYGNLTLEQNSLIKYDNLCLNLIKEIQELKKKLDYLRSGEYYNQLRFENEMLQQVVDTNGVPSEVYDYIDCTHRNTELLEENQELKKQLEEWNYHLKCSKEMLDIQGHNGNYNYDSYMLGIYNGMEYIIALFETREPIFKSGKDIEFISDKNQQKEFIEYLEDLIKQNETVVEVSKYGLPKNCSKLLIDFYKEILSKYKSIIGGK